MGSHDFNPFGNVYINVQFPCEKCGDIVYSENIGIPSPDFSADTHEQSTNYNSDFTACDNCGETFDIYISAGYHGGHVEIPNVDDESIKVNEVEEKLDSFYLDHINAIIDSAEYHTFFESEIDNLKQLNKTPIEGAQAQKTMRRLVFSGAITCLEDYLSTTLIQQVLNREEYFKNFVQTYKPYSNKKFSLNQIYDRLDKIRDEVKKSLLDVIYHNLSVVKNMYESTLKIDFGNIAELSKSINIRHDMVHRNGKDKNGLEIDVSAGQVDELIISVENFVKELQEKIDSKNGLNEPRLYI